MNERLQSVRFETEPEPEDSDRFERSVGRNVLQTLVVEREPVGHDSKESKKRPDGLVYAQDQEEYRPFAEAARAIILQALSGDLDALKQFHRQDISGALTARITARLAEYGDASSIPVSEIDGMISIACGALAEKAGVDDNPIQAAA